LYSSQYSRASSKVVTPNSKLARRHLYKATPSLVEKTPCLICTPPYSCPLISVKKSNLPPALLSVNTIFLVSSFDSILVLEASPALKFSFSIRDKMAF
jgi:hypothetical protein